VTYRLAAQYQWSPSLMTYASYSTGFKSGGFVQRNASFLPALPSFGPETVSVIEGGFKLDAFDRRVRLNAAGFLNRYNDLQITVLQPTGLINAPVTANAGKARINGFEADAEAILGAGFSVIAGLGHLNAYYTDLAANAIGVTRDNKLVRSPKWSGNLSLLNELSAGPGMLNTRLDLAFSSRVYYDTSNLSSQDGYAVLNGTITYALSNSGLAFTLGGRNLTDKRYFVSADNKTVPGDVGTFLVTYARPREFFAQAAYRF
jgi:iron complex outermembrane receptor protein